MPRHNLRQIVLERIERRKETYGFRSRSGLNQRSGSRIYSEPHPHPITDYPLAFLIDGTRAMQAAAVMQNINFDINARQINWPAGDVTLRRGGAFLLDVWDPSTPGYADAALFDLYVDSDIISTNVGASEFYTGNAVGCSWGFYAHSGVAYVRCMNMHGGGGTPCIDIERPGDFTTIPGIGYHHRIPDTRPAAPIAGDSRYDPVTNTLEYRDAAGVWQAH